MPIGDPGSPSPGEIGGIFAGIVALLASIGGGIAWLLNWAERRASSRAEKLQVWHDELKARETDFEKKRTDFEARLEETVADLRKENQALRLAFQLVASPLRQIDPDNPALVRAEQLLVAAIPLDPVLTAELETLIAAIPDTPEA